MKKIISVFSICILLSSCSISTHYLEGTEKYTPTSMEEVQIFTEDISEEYIVIGSIATAAAMSQESAIKFLKKKAAAIGADAIIFTKPTSMSSFDTAYGYSGVAVKRKK
mgnify:CR=1 FL=1